jgi:HEAT repeat protein
LRDLVMAYLERASQGYEEQLGSLFAQADVDLGLGIVRVLAKLGTPAARNAILRAGQSPHPVVRIEALGHVEGASSERLRIELRSLLEDKDENVRVAALRAMERYNIRIAGPFLVLRIKSADFDRQSQEERRQALTTLAALAPGRAEAIAIEILAETRVMASDAHEQSRELAADVLGKSANSAEAMNALQTAAAKRWLGGSERVRTAASKAIEAIAARSVGSQVGAQARK